MCLYVCINVWMSKREAGAEASPRWVCLKLCPRGGRSKANEYWTMGCVATQTLSWPECLLLTWPSSYLVTVFFRLLTHPSFFNAFSVIYWVFCLFIYLFKFYLRGTTFPWGNHEKEPWILNWGKETSKCWDPKVWRPVLCFYQSTSLNILRSWER